MLRDLKVFLLSPRGFCAGVIRAIETVKRALDYFDPPVYVKHRIVHNDYVVQELEKKGAIFIEDLEEVPQGAPLIYSAHGVPPATRELAKKRHLIEIDATCGLVTKVHSAVKRYAKQGYHILLIGHRNHVEVVGTLGQAPHAITLIESLEDIERLSFPMEQKLFVITQTTLSVQDVEKLVASLKEKYPSIESLPSSSICYATTNRQSALQSILSQCDRVLVIGDRESSNANRLKELGENAKIASQLIPDVDHLSLNWLFGAKALALTAGASTPEFLIQDCLDRLKLWGIRDESIEEIVYTEEDMVFQPPQFLKSGIFYSKS
jgi:4-hydroxy-3-methylbut-2-en-1-yl diphosphate reductase